MQLNVPARQIARRHNHGVDTDACRTDACLACEFHPKPVHAVAGTPAKNAGETRQAARKAGGTRESAIRCPIRSRRCRRS